MNYPHPLLAREGWPFIGLAAVASLLLTLLWGWQSAVPAYIVLVFVVQFFRDPPRAVPDVANAVLSPADGRIALQVEAATAFGSGEHATTRGCLSLIASAIARRKPRNALDVGCGSGILAMAIARLAQIPVTAVDIDEEAVRVTRENTRINGVRRQVRVSRSDGFHSDVIAKSEKYDLIVANILAGPLCKMAPDFRRHLAAGGRLILSGLLNDQETRVIAACRNQRLGLRRRWRSDGWSALEFSCAG